MHVIFTILGLPYQFQKEVLASSLTPQVKKLLRLEISSALPLNLIPFHACLLQKNNQSLLIAGSSNSGKSTLAQDLIQKGYTLLANDFVVVYLKNGKLYAGDLNLQKHNQNKPVSPISEIVFLSPDDPRDIFRFTRQEAVEFYFRSLHPLKLKTLRTYTNNPMFTKIIEIHRVLGNRKTPHRWTGALAQSRIFPSINRIGIIGLGVIGQDLANLLLNESWLRQLHLFTTNVAQLDAIALDLKSGRPDLNITTHSGPKNLFKNSDIVIICFRQKNSSVSVGVEERTRRLLPHAEVMWSLSRCIRQVHFPGIVLIITNPVDSLAAYLYTSSQINDKGKPVWDGLYSSQIYGVGLGLDYNRLQVIKPGSNLEVIGPHNENLFLCRPNSSNTLKVYSDPELLKLIKTYSETVRKGTPRTRFGPAHEILNVIRHFHQPQSHIRVSTLNPYHAFLGEAVSITRRVPQAQYSYSSEVQKLIRTLSQNQLSLTNQIPESKILPNSPTL